MSNRPITFLMYHELEIAGRSLCRSEQGYARYVLPESTFRDEMNYLKKNAWQGLNVSEAIQYPEGKTVAITFDDGCETDLLAAAPILRENGLNATFFITCGWLGTRGFLSRSLVKELSALGFEIGSHSMTHPYLTDCDDAMLRHEIVDSKAELEQIIGRPVEHFSCPGGRCDARVAAVGRDAGYRTVATSRTHANSWKTDGFALGRVAILRDTSLAQFGAICDGSALPSMRLQNAIRNGAKQILGNSLYDRMRSRLLRRN
ncbi:MAG TPA: polysaccharide deacetylase family protein [Candidatus Sulfotelmatobacter sp.]|nr:polysaccharide deacetylase family protein [Candidatus Sulfotelmatobacter sp.]